MAQHIALLKYRLYRISEDVRLHVMAEIAEDLILRSDNIPAQVADFLSNADAFCRGRTATIDLANMERALGEAGYDLNHELSLRFAHFQAGRIAGVKGAVHIVGAPRSGTSILYYRLAHTGRFAYFCSDSHQLWHTYRLGKSSKLIFEKQHPDLLRKDTKSTRLRFDLLFPSEAEHIWNRAVPCYRHMALHDYRLEPPAVHNLSAVRNNIANHCAAQGQDIFLSKSPFNSLRIAALREVLPGRTKFVHISRNSADCTASITRNKFRYGLEDGKFMSSAKARHIFEKAISDSAKCDMYSIRYEDLQNCDNAIADLIDWIVEDG